MRKYSQNFLQSHKIRDKIVKLAELQPNDEVLEIGPGKGVLTEKLLEKAHLVTAIEKDPDLIPYLKEAFPSLKLLLKDALEVDYHTFGKIKLISNLPYHITTDFLMKVSDSKIEEIVLMLQLEAVKRLTHLFPSSLTTAFIQHTFTIQEKFTVSKKHFSPAPKIDSAVITLKRQDGFNSDFLSYLKIAFKHKRKTLKSNLKENYSLESCELGSKRPDKVTSNEHYAIYQKLSGKKTSQQTRKSF